MKTLSNDVLGDLSAYCEQHNLMGSLANVSALLMASQPEINWLGFYLFDGEKLILGPFQGHPACTQIAMGKGVCGTAAQQRRTVRVDNVDEFPGHIVCDSRSKSEIVIPMIQNGRLIGVLDVDSPRLARFNHKDQEFYEKAVSILLANLNFGSLQ